MEILFSYISDTTQTSDELKNNTTKRNSIQVFCCPVNNTWFGITALFPEIQGQHRATARNIPLTKKVVNLASYYIIKYSPTD